MRLEATLRDEELRRKLKAFGQALNKSGGEVVTEMARIGSNQLAFRIEPYGLSKKSKDILEGAVFKDASKVFWDTGRAYNEIKKLNPGLATAYAKAMNAGDTQKAERIAASVITGFKVNQPTESHLDASRNRRGRVDNATPQGTERKDLEALKAKIALTAGTAKAGWLQAGASIGSKTRIPKWLKKAFVLGSSRINRSGWNTVVTLINHVRYTSEVLPEAKIQAAMRNALNNQLKRMKAIAASLGRTV